MSHHSNYSRSPDYYAARAIEERRLAMAAKDPKVRAIHLELADSYAERASLGEVEHPQALGEQQGAG